MRMLLRYLGTAFVYLFSLWLIGMMAIFWILGVDGPNSPEPSQLLRISSYFACTLAVLVLPALAARRYWKSSGPPRGT